MPRIVPNLRNTSLRRDEVVRLRDEEKLPWRLIAERLDAPVSPILDAYNRQR